MRLRGLYAVTPEASDAVDKVRIAPVLRVRDGKKWMVSTGGLALTFHVGRRPALGWLLAVVPRRLARATA